LGTRAGNVQGALDRHLLGTVDDQLLDRAAFHSTIEVLQLAHNVAVAVCPDGPRFAGDSTGDDYRPAL
jgi:hypothetical protein